VVQVNTRPFTATILIFLAFDSLKFLVWISMRARGFPDDKFIHDVAASVAGLAHSLVGCTICYEALRSERPAPAAALFILPCLSGVF
jgi:hypothetical protein